jgi:plasmid stabilization system protein ParE
VRIAFHPGAVADLIGAGDWYERQVSGLGLDLTEEVDRALIAITERPEAWPRWPGVDAALEVRRFLLARFPYAIAYLTRDDELVVLAVAHVRRRPGYWLERAGREP